MLYCQIYQRRSVLGVFRNKRNAIRAITFFSCFLCSLSIVASQQEYIEAIEADVDEFSSGTFESPEESSWVGSDLKENGGSTKKTESLESFSVFLKKESPGTYIFYKKLPLEFKQKVLEEYLEIGDIERTKKSILRYATSRRKK